MFKLFESFRMPTVKLFYNRVHLYRSIVMIWLNTMYQPSLQLPFSLVLEFCATHCLQTMSRRVWHLTSRFILREHSIVCWRSIVVCFEYSTIIIIRLKERNDREREKKNTHTHPTLKTMSSPIHSTQTSYLLTITM